MGKYITPTFPSKTKQFYDANGNIIKTQVKVNEQGEPERYATTDYEYDKINRPICVTQNGSIIQYSYDAMGNVTKCWQDNGTKWICLTS